MSESKQRLTESVSALVDGEVSELELHRILKEFEVEQSENRSIDDSQGITGKWSRYHLISHVMADAELGAKDISQSVSSAIAQEKPHKTGSLLGSIQFVSVGRFAIAASVAVMAIIGVQQLNNLSPMDDSSLQSASATNNSSQQLQRPAMQFPSGFQPNIEARTVNAGGVVKTSQPPAKLIKLFTTSDTDKKKSAELENPANEDLPVDVEQDVSSE